MGRSSANGLPALSYHCRDAWCTDISPMTQTVGILYYSDKDQKGEKCLYVAMNFSATMGSVAIPRLPGKTSLKYVFGTDGFDTEIDGGSVRIPPCTMWFFEEKMSNSTLKMIALFTMMIDHIGAFLFPDQILYRIIGRIAFAIYIFLIVEGYHKTRDVKKYILRLFYLL